MWNPHGRTYTQPALVSYSAATGKMLQVLYRYQSQCGGGVALPLWTGPSARRVIGLITNPLNGKAPNSYVFGVIAGGHLRPLPALVDGAAPQTAFLGTSYIAF